MKVLTWEEFISQPRPIASRGTAMTIGVFDGIHTGHQELINRIVTQDHSLAPVVLTFINNPKALLRPDEFEGDIFSLDQKIAVLNDLGIGLLVLIDFSKDFGKMTGREFIDLLRDRGSLRYLAVGNDFRCGYRLDTDANAIREMTAAYGVVSEIVEPVFYAGAPVSSSRIRAAIATGNLVEATALLGRYYVFDMRPAAIPRGDDSRETVVRTTRRIIPPDGRYRVRLKQEMNSEGITSVAHILDRVVVIPDPISEVRFVEFIPNPV